MLTIAIFLFKTWLHVRLFILGIMIGHAISRWYINKFWLPKKSIMFGPYR